MKNKAGNLESVNPVVFFDGVCNLCNDSINFIIDRDKEEKFRFSALQAPAAKPYLKKCTDETVAAGEVLHSIILIEAGNCYRKSAAALRIARRLDGLWPLLYIFVLVPAFIRDGVYDWVAANRYKWFGREETCRIPTPELRARFLDPLERPSSLTS